MTSEFHTIATFIIVDIPVFYTEFSHLALYKILYQTETDIWILCWHHVVVQSTKKLPAILYIFQTFTTKLNFKDLM